MEDGKTLNTPEYVKTDAQETRFRALNRHSAITWLQRADDHADLLREMRYLGFCILTLDRWRVSICSLALDE